MKLMSLAHPRCPPLRCPDQRQALFEELAELSGQRNAIDRRIVISSPGSMATVCGALPARGPWRPWSPGRPAALRPMRTHRQRGASPEVEFPRCAKGMREAGWPWIGRRDRAAGRAGPAGALRRVGRGRDGHPAAHRRQARTTARSRPRPEPRLDGTKTSRTASPTGGSNFPHLGRKFDAALASHQDALIAEWKEDRADPDGASGQVPPFPGTVDAFCAWSDLVGCRGHPHRPMGGTAPWWSMSTSSSVAAALHWVRCSLNPTVVI